MYSGSHDKNYINSNDVVIEEDVSINVSINNDVEM